MDISSRVVTLVGAVMILTAVLTIVSVGLMGASSSDKDPFEREEAAEFLTDVNDNEELLLAGTALGIINDGVLIIAIAAGVVVLFRDRSAYLAILSALGFTLAVAISLVVDGSNLLLTILADDFANGSGELPPGDPAVLEVGRTLGVITFVFTNVLFTAAGTALLSLGLLLTGARQGLVNPPKWIGWIAVVAGLSAWLAWLVVVADPGFIFFPIQLISTVIFLIALGVWLLRHSDLEPASM